ncbi:MAG TPA: chemotaxis protein CheD [Opitutaceae bacterium]|nr:chemotaxis protein CheD [Opitutaceae bacterium]
MGSPTIADLFAQRVVVGVGDMGVSNNPSFTLSTYALGSCVGIAAYDPTAKVGGLLHIMLPDSSISADKAQRQPAMFADTGLPLLMNSLVGLRAEPSRLRLMLAGGASVLNVADNFKIGERNIRATSDWLRKHGFAVRHAVLGGTINRTVYLNVGTGAITLKMPNVNETLSLAA